MASKPRVKVPSKANAGEVITIKTIISHKMESGQRKNKKGEVIPRMIINRFEVTLDGQMVFAADIDPAVSSNPYLEFKTKVEKSGTFRFRWVDDGGDEFVKEQKITVG